MKTRIFKFLSIALFLMVAVACFAQSPSEVIDNIKDADNFDELLGMHTAIMTALIILGGYLSPFIPFLKNIPSTVYRVLAFAVIIIVGAVMFGFGDIWSGAIAYAFSTSLYEVVLSWFAKTKKAKEV